MNRATRFLASLKDPARLIQLLLVLGGLFIAYTLLSATGGPPKPWEEKGPSYLVGAMEAFTRTVPSDPLPTVRLDNLGTPKRLDEVAPGRTLVVNLWATWCAPCLEELPSLAALQDELGDSAVVVAVAQEGGDGARQKAMLERLGAENLTLLLDPKLSVSRSLGSDVVLPVTLIYNSRGREIGRLIGSADWSAPESVRLVRAVAGGRIPR